MPIPIKKITVTDAVTEHLKERIQTLEFGPGDKLPSEQQLLREYEVSRLTLREALAKLAAWGIIHVRHGKGAYVSQTISVPALNNVLTPMFPQVDLQGMRDLVEARNLIESEIAAKAALKRTKADIRILEGLLRFSPGQINTPEEFAKRDFDFHLSLAKMAGNGFLLSMYQALHLQIQSFLKAYARSIQEDWETALGRHGPILKALKDKDPDSARRLAREHAGICASFIDGYNG